MARLDRWVLTAILGFITSLPALAQAPATDGLNPPVEIRAIWLDAGSMPKTRAGIVDLVRSYKAANLNLIMPEVICRGYTIYPTPLLARDPRFADTIDPLPILIAESHKLGIEVHPWAWIFRAGYTKDRGAILTAHPDWAETDKFGDQLSANGGLWISPAIPQAREFVISLLEDLAKRYDIDGIHLDYIRYEVQSPTPFGYSQASRELFGREYGVDPIDVDRLSFQQYSWVRFRERQVNAFVQEMSKRLRKISPRLKISAAVGSDPSASRLNLMQNWPYWAQNGWIDFITPMAYTADDSRFGQLVESQKAAIGTTALLAPGIGLHMQTKTPEQTVRQIGIARNAGVDGQALFAAAYFKKPQGTALTAGPYKTPSLLPFRDTPKRILELQGYAAALSNKGETAEAEWAEISAKRLQDYQAFAASPKPYIAPTDPPLDIPKIVQPIPQASATRADAPIVVDGDLSEAVWQQAKPVELAFTNTAQPAPVSTQAWLAYDDTNLYAAFRCGETTMSSVLATDTKRDGPVFYDDSVEMFIDPEGIGKIYYHLSANTLGTQFDQKVLNPGWNGEWKCAAKLGADGWTVEFAIPFAALETQAPKPGTLSRINLTRNRGASTDRQYICWSVPYGSFHSPDRFGKVVF